MAGTGADHVILILPGHGCNPRLLTVFAASVDSSELLVPVGVVMVGTLAKLLEVLAASVDTVDVTGLASAANALDVVGAIELVAVEDVRWLVSESRLVLAETRLLAA